MLKKIIAVAVDLAIVAMYFFAMSHNEVFWIPLDEIFFGASSEAILAALLPIVAIFISYFIRRSDLKNSGKGSIFSRFKFNIYAIIFIYGLSGYFLYLAKSVPGGGMGGLTYAAPLFASYGIAIFVAFILSLRISLANK